MMNGEQEILILTFLFKDSGEVGRFSASLRRTKVVPAHQVFLDFDLMC